ncbi:MAG: alpha/beta fold hydrolase [Anaerolineales bacterium]
MIVPTAPPFFYPGGSTGCLLIHGFTGSPKEMQPLGEYLSKQGYTALGIRLFAHATSPDDMNRARWQDWVASVDDGWYLLQESVDEVFIIGLSMGGVLALYETPHLPVVGTVTLSTPYQLIQDPRIPLMKYFWRLLPFVSKGESDWQDPDQTEQHFSYDAYPSRAIYELVQLLDEMQKTLPQIHVPVLLMHSKDDLTVPPENMVEIYEHLGTPEDQKEMVYIEKSGHVLTRDIKKDLVFQHIGQFVKDKSSSAS